MGILFFILGACFGSFFSVCIYRIPRKKSIVLPRSFCPKCEHLIPWYYNIPIISYLLLKGRCKYCKEKISGIYPVIEILSGIVFLLSFIKFGISIELPIYLAFFSLLIVGSFIDIEFELLPDVITIPGIILGLATSFLTIGIRSSLIGGAIGAIVILAFAGLGRLLFKKEAMGGGDVKLLAMIGCFTGWVNVLWALFFGAIIGLIFGLLRKKERLSFGPFLGMGSFIVVIFGIPIGVY